MECCVWPVSESYPGLVAASDPTDTVLSDSWEHLGRQFRSDYAAKNGGREPPMDPDPRGYWDRVQSDNFTRTDYNETIQFYQYLAQWINDDILGGHNDETCSKGM